MMNIGIFPRERIYHYRKEIFKRLSNNPNYNVKFFVDENKYKNEINSKKISTSSFKVFGKEFKYQRKLRKKINKNKLDIVIISFSPYYISNLLLLLFNKNRDYKIVALTHGYFKGSKLNSFKNKILKFILKKVDAILFYTEDIAKHYLEEGFNKEKLFFMDNTIDTDKINRIKDNYNSENLNIKEKFNIKEEQKAIIFVGRFIESKRPLLLLKALKYLKENYNESPFLFMIGSGDLEKKLKNYAKSNLGENDIAFLGKIIDEEELAPFFLGSDLFIMPGKTGLSINHAFSYDLPYITTDDNIHAPEITLLTPGQNGEYFYNEDYKDLASTIHELISEENKLKRYSRNANEVIMNRYNITNMENKFIELFDKLRLE